VLPESHALLPETLKIPSRWNRKKRIKEFIPYDDILAEILPGDSKTDEPVLRQEYQSILEKAIAELPPRQKAVFSMRYFDELTFEDMSKILNKSVGGTKANYFHALQKISKVVRKETNQ